ncbi:MAG: ABC transporter substrate-binding protein [Deltaproteobacteria bacterium]|nr:ABC transporter substrate-binding protein [Deltaproteobacteria bacterium]
MTNIRLSLSCGDYDRTRPLIDETVPTPGLDLTIIPLPSAERHTRFVRNLEFDVCELQIAQYLSLKSRGVPITAIPVFPHRRFNHSCVMVRMDSHIARPEDLRGRRIGVHAHFNPIALWIRGLLQHEFDVRPSEIHWVSDGSEDMPGWSPPPWLRIERAPAADASTINKVVRRLWPNYREVEADYYRRTGIFPIRHLIVVKDEVLQHNPAVATHLVSAFEAAKQQAYRYWADHRRSSLAWFGAEQEEERALLGPDPWPYSVEKNQVVLETLLDYAAEQGLTERRLDIKEIFAPSTRDS